MSTTSQATELFEQCETALAICGLPEFTSADADGLEVLKYFGDDETWALVPVDGSADEYVAVDTDMACNLLRCHFRDWLLLRGFQIQVRCFATVHRWTLVDCLCAAEGGGDRLDVDYPVGEDELAVFVDSVIALNTL